MRRRRAVVESLAEVPDWVFQHVPKDWPVTEPAPADWGFIGDMWERVSSHGAWSLARRDWLAEHAPHLSGADLRHEQARRFPVVVTHPAASLPQSEGAR